MGNVFITGLNFFAFLLFFPAISLYAQKAPETVPADTNKDEIILLVNLTAKELKFDIVPNVTVEFPGTHERTKIWITQRQNLPDKVEPGVTYRDIGIQLRISSRFADIERIVSEALGEIPTSNDEAVATAPVVTPPIPVASPATTAAKKRPKPVRPGLRRR